MSDPIPYQYAERILARLGDASATLVLVGGQALNFWAEYYIDTVPELAEGAPYTSKDIDFCADREAMRECARRLRGQLKLPAAFDPTPSTGKVVFRDDDGTEREIDFISSPFGLQAADVFKTSIRADILDEAGAPTGRGFLVMHPERCLRSRGSNYVGLAGYQTPHALKQLRAAILCAKAYAGELADSGRSGEALEIYERVWQYCMHDHHGRRVLAVAGLDPFDVVQPQEALPAMFNTFRYPQMREMLARRRAKMKPRA